jgi:dephospho-CoA kinase
VHELYDTAEVREAVVARFGEAVAPGGVVDRGALAGRAFATDQDRAWLEGLLWPLVDARMAAWRSGLERQSPPPRAAVVEVPLLFEADMGHGFDATIAVVAIEPLRAERAGARGHAALEARSARQLTQQEKAQRATYVVENDGTIADLDAKLSNLLELLAR